MCRQRYDNDAEGPIRRGERRGGGGGEVGGRTHTVSAMPAMAPTVPRTNPPTVDGANPCKINLLYSAEGS